MSETKKLTIKSFVGAGPSDQEASYWTQEDWDKHHAEVARLKETGEYGKPIEATFIFTPNPDFDEPVNHKYEWGMFIPKGNIDDSPLPTITSKYTNDELKTKFEI